MKNAITIEQVLTEKKTYDLSQSFEKVDLDEKSLGWTEPGTCSSFRLTAL